MKNHTLVTLAALAAILPAGTRAAGDTTQKIQVAAANGAMCKLTGSLGSYFVTTPGHVTIRKAEKNLRIACTKDGFQSAAQTIAPQPGGKYPGSVTIAMTPLPGAALPPVAQTRSPARLPTLSQAPTTVTVDGAPGSKADNQIASAAPLVVTASSQPPLSNFSVPLREVPAPPVSVAKTPVALAQPLSRPAPQALTPTYASVPSTATTMLTSLTVDGTEASSAPPGSNPPIIRSVTAQTNVDMPNGKHADIMPWAHFTVPNGNGVTLRRDLVATNGPGAPQQQSVPIIIPASGQKGESGMGQVVNCGAARYYLTQRVYILDADGNRSNAITYTIHCNGG